MQISQLVETADGSFTYSATLTQNQHAFLIEYAIKDLVHKGLLPFTVTADDRAHTSVIAQMSEVPS